MAEFERFLKTAQDLGYAQMSVRQFVDSLRQPHCANRKVIIHRHDIDSDLRTTRKLFQLEKKYNIRSSYYFRLSTLDFALMRDIEDYGSEASYHYEELSTYAKRHKIRDAAAIHERMPEIREEFVANFRRIENRLGTRMNTVASHGDFVNRKLKLRNTEILNDPTLRADCGIVCESYDAALLDNTDLYIGDRPYPQNYYPTSPAAAIGKYNKIYLLTHPRQCETNWRENTKENLSRLYEHLTW
ncbi:MAG: hypothetical protein ABIT83_12045 [Massilia sp.]